MFIGLKLVDDHISSSSKKQVSVDHLRKRIYWVLNNAGLGNKGLTSHSLQRDAPTVALRNRVEPKNLRKVDRWKTKFSMLNYIERRPIQ